MGKAEPVGQDLGSMLLEAGWKQGVLFTSGTARFVYNRVPTQQDEQFAVSPERALKPNEKLVLITQTCDLKANNDEPYAEALICKIEKSQKMLNSAERNSARRFLIDPETRLVAQAKYRVVLAKELLMQHTSEPWPSGLDRFERFVRWLARRYDRPAVPDQIVEALQQPLEATLARIDQEHPQRGAAFSRAIQEIRVNLPATEEPPFDLQLVFILRGYGIDQDESDAISATIDEIRGSLDQDIVQLHDDIRLVTEEEISVAEYRATRPLFLEYLTYKGDEVEGAQPQTRV